MVPLTVFFVVVVVLKNTFKTVLSDMEAWFCDGVAYLQDWQIQKTVAAIHHVYGKSLATHIIVCLM